MAARDAQKGAQPNGDGDASGQRCDASKPAKRKRSRIRTHSRIDKRTRLGKRIAELKASITAAVGAADSTPLLPMRIERAAALTAMAEAERLKFLRDGTGLERVMWLEGKSDTAIAALGIEAESPTDRSSPLDRWTKWRP
jgi:hypothetical protein